MSRIEKGWRVAFALPFLVGCAGSSEKAAVADASKQRHEYTSLAVGQSRVEEDRPGTTAPDEGHLEGTGTLARYIATAMDKNPNLQGAFDRWHASVARISQARTLPDPQISFGYFVQSVETRVGPQLARISLTQSFPWPTRLTRGADSASARARSLQRLVEAQALVIKQQVETAYFRLWLIRQTKRIHEEHLTVVRSLSESVLARVATGATNLADQQQVDLTAARLEDMISGMEEAESVAIAELHAAMGVAEPAQPRTPEGPPEALLPAEERSTLAASVREHPLIESHGEMAISNEELARAKRGARYPTFSLGADWIIIGEAVMPGVDDSGKDAVMVGAGMSVPLWQGAYDDGIRAARAEAEANRSDQAAAEDRALAELEASLSAVRDAVRRVKLYKTTLVPQADSAYASVLGAYATGQGTVAQTLLAQRDLLELRSELEAARADYAMAWTRLERIVGRHVEPLEADLKMSRGRDD